MKIWLVYSPLGKWAFDSVEKAEKKYRQQISELSAHTDSVTLHTFKLYREFETFSIFDEYAGGNYYNSVDVGYKCLNVE